MASDKLVQVSKKLRQTQDNIQHDTRRFSKNMPLVEKSSDYLGTLYTYKLDFKTYGEPHTVLLSLKFLPKFKKLDARDILIANG